MMKSLMLAGLIATIVLAVACAPADNVGDDRSGAAEPARLLVFEPSSVIQEPRALATLSNGALIAIEYSYDGILMDGPAGGQQIHVRRGRGPGEALALGRVFPTSDGFAAWDDGLRRVNFFTENGRFLSSRRLSAWPEVGSMQLVLQLRDGRYVALHNLNADRMVSGVPLIDTIDVLVGWPDSIPRRVAQVTSSAHMIVDNKPASFKEMAPEVSPKVLAACEEGVLLFPRDSITHVGYDGVAVRALPRFWPAFPAFPGQPAKDSLVPEPIISEDATLWLSVPGGRRYAQFQLDGTRLRAVQIPGNVVLRHAVRDRLFGIVPDSDGGFGLMRLPDVAVPYATPFTRCQSVKL